MTAKAIKRIEAKRAASMERAARKAKALLRINGNRVNVVYPTSLVRGQKYLQSIGVPYSKTITGLIAS